MQKQQLVSQNSGTVFVMVMQEYEEHSLDLLTFNSKFFRKGFINAYLLSYTIYFVKCLSTILKLIRIVFRHCISPKPAAALTTPGEPGPKAVPGQLSGPTPGAALPHRLGSCGSPATPGWTRAERAARRLRPDPAQPYLDRLGVRDQAAAVHLLHGPAGLRAASKLDEGDASGLVGALVAQQPDVLDVPERGEALPNQRLARVLAQHHENAAVGRLVQALGRQPESAALLHGGAAARLAGRSGALALLGAGRRATTGLLPPGRQHGRATSPRGPLGRRTEPTTSGSPPERRAQCLVPPLGSATRQSEEKARRGGLRDWAPLQDTCPAGGAEGRARRDPGGTGCSEWRGVGSPRLCRQLLVRWLPLRKSLAEAELASVRLEMLPLLACPAKRLKLKMSLLSLSRTLLLGCPWGVVSFLFCFRLCLFALMVFFIQTCFFS